MRSHIIGFAIFVAIVSISMGFLNFFTSQEIYDVGPVVDISPVVERQLKESDLKELSYYVTRAEYDVDNKTLRAYVNFRWAGSSLPPRDFAVKMNILDSETGEIITFRRAFVGSIFGSERIASYSVRFTDVSPELFSDTTNIYTFVEFAPDQTADVFRNAAYIKPEFTPVLMIHGKRSENN